MRFYAKPPNWKWHFALYPVWCDKCGCGIWLEDCWRKFSHYAGREGIKTFDTRCKVCKEQETGKDVNHGF
ncbi:MAG: hypothetical protein WC455_13445 [Dehalococcoidia bacterium]